MNRVLKSYIFAIGLLLLPQFQCFSQGTWEVLETPTQQHLRSVYFTDSLYGWAVGDTGTIIHTSDGGASWVIQDAGTTNNIVNVFFLNRQEGWASSWNFEGFFGTLILKTTDGGSTWTHHPYQEDNIFINCILYSDALNGWMGGSPHAIVSTHDGGISWEQASVDTTALAFFPVLNIYFYDDQYGYACGGMFDIAGVTWSTSNGGQSWQPIANIQAPADEIHGMHLFDSTTVLGAGGDPDLGYGVGMLRTDDGGTNWDYEELSMAGNAFDIDFRNDTEAWAPLGPAQQMIYSLDAGTSWTLIPTPFETSIFDMIFTDTTHGFGVGYHGAVIRYIPKPVGIADILTENGISFKVFPNPARDVVSFSVQLDGRLTHNPDRGEMIIYDKLGTIVKHINLDEPGDEKIAITDMSDLPPGMYLCMLKLTSAQDEIIITKKLLLR